jgi:hypothetical protein
MTKAEIIAAGLTHNQRALLDDLVGCPGLFAGQYVVDGVALEYLPDELVERTYEGAAGFMGLAKANPSELGLSVSRILTGDQ